jgi:hypothetical protein
MDCKSIGLRLRRFESYLPHHPEAKWKSRKLLARSGHGADDSTVASVSAEPRSYSLFQVIVVIRAPVRRDRFGIPRSRALSAF